MMFIALVLGMWMPALVVRPVSPTSVTEPAWLVDTGSVPPSDTMQQDLRDVSTPAAFVAIGAAAAVAATGAYVLRRRVNARPVPAE